MPVETSKRALEPVPVKSTSKGKFKVPPVEDEEMEDAASSAHEEVEASEPDEAAEEDAEDGEEEIDEEEELATEK